MVFPSFKQSSEFCSEKMQELPIADEVLPFYIWESCSEMLAFNYFLMYCRHLLPSLNSP